MKKMIIGVVATVMIATTAFLGYSHTVKADCCAPGKACCYKGSPCCTK